MRRQLAHKDSSYNQNEGEFVKKIAAYEANLGNLGKNHEELRRQFEDTDKMLRQKHEEAANLDNLAKRRVGELENAGRRVQELEQENGNLRRRIEEVGGDSSRRLNEFQLQNKHLNEEYEKAKERHVETERFGEELEKERKADEERKSNEETERKASIKQPPAFAGPRINLPAPYYEAPRVPGKPWIGIPIPPQPSPLPSAE